MGVWERILAQFAEVGYLTIVEIAALTLFLIYQVKLAGVIKRMKNSMMGYFSTSDIKKDYEIKRSLIELTDTLGCSTSMLLRLHNGESAGDYFHFRRVTAVFDEPRRGAILRMDGWQGIGYGIFASRMQRLFKDKLVFGPIEGNDQDYSYTAFHKSKGIYYEILMPIYLMPESRNEVPFGYLAAFFNKEQAMRMRQQPDTVDEMVADVKSVRDFIETKLNMNGESWLFSGKLKLPGA